MGKHGSQGDERDLEEARRIASKCLRGQRARVFLFGSRAMGRALRGSDVDIAVLPIDPLEPGTLSRLREALEESSIPFAVDVVDLSRASESIRARVLAEGVAWDV